MDGVAFMRKGGRKVALQRMLNQNRAQLKAFADKANPELKAFQDKYRKLTLADIANADETGWDICALSSAMVYVFLKAFGNLVDVPVEQSPYFTLVVGHAGGKRMCILMIMKGPEHMAPSTYHMQCLDEDSMVFLAQTSTGWITPELKLAFFKLQVEKGILGQRPMFCNVDGHSSNIDNVALKELCDEHKILLLIPPSHTSAAVDGMGTQQADRPAHQGGPIARLKMFLRHNYMKQWFANLQDPKVPNRVDIAEIVKLVDVSWRESFQPEKMSRLNAEVGYYIDDEGYLQWDLTRLLLKDLSAPAPPLGAVPEEAARAPGPAPALAAPPAIPDADALMPLATSRFGGREAQQRAMADTVTNVARMRAEVTALQSAIGLAQAPVVDRPTHKIRRGQSARAHTREGMVIGSDDWKRRVDKDKEEAAQPPAKRARTMDSFWSNHREEVLEAEAALLAAGGNVVDMKKVGDLKERAHPLVHPQGPEGQEQRWRRNPRRSAGRGGGPGQDAHARRSGGFRSIILR